MRVALLSYGTRGDVQPLVAIALALQARGHDVVLGTPTNHVAFVERAGVRAAPLTGDSEAILQSEQGRRWVSEGDARSLAAAVVNTAKTLRDDVDRDVEAATAGADVIVSGVLAAGMARIQRDARKIPLVLAHTFPSSPTRAYHNAIVDLPLGLPGPVNLAVTALVLRLSWFFLRDIDDAVRRRRGLPLCREDPIAEQARTRGPGLQLWSEHLLPKPADWGDNESVTGFCRLPPTARSGLGEDAGAAALAAFLDAGDPPLFIGLGSMPIFDPRAVLERFCSVAEKLSCRLIVGGTFHDADAVRALLPSFARLSGPADHDALFPRCRAVLHHGGAGSTATSLRAGRATLVCPVLGDQHFWGRVVKRRGVGDNVPFRRLTADRLRAGLETILQPQVQQKAAALGELLRAEEDGALFCARILEKIVSAA